MSYYALGVFSDNSVILLADRAFSTQAFAQKYVNGCSKTLRPFVVGEVEDLSSTSMIDAEKVAELQGADMTIKKPRTTAAELMLGVDADHLDQMQHKINCLERENDAIALTRVRHAINQRLVEIRLLLRDGHLKNLNRF